MINYFTEKYPPRELQVRVIKAIDKAWATSDVIVLRASVGSGKTFIADCIARYVTEREGRAVTVCVPTNVLVGQFMNECPNMTTSNRRHAGHNNRTWEIEKQRLRNAQCKVMNYYSYLAHRAYTPVVVFDEVQAVAPMLIELDSMKFWKHSYHYPENVRSTLDLLKWASGSCFVDDKKIQKLIKALTAAPTSYTFDIDYELWRGESRQRLKVRPLSPSSSRPILWPPSRVHKMVMMSATISEEDIADLGLDKKRVTFIDGGSAIPAVNRPVLYSPIGSMAAASQDRNLDKVVKKIEELLDKHEGSKGLIHLTYGLSRKLRTTSLYHDERLIWHGKDNKTKKLNEWFEADPSSGKVLMACGLTEGLDVKGDLGRWQAILKLPYLNKGDVAVAAKLEQRPQWYAWQCIKDVEQAVGRICRGPDDYGITYILDSSFSRLYNDNKHLFSTSFKEALQ